MSTLNPPATPDELADAALAEEHVPLVIDGALTDAGVAYIESTRKGDHDRRRHYRISVEVYSGDSALLVFQKEDEEGILSRVHDAYSIHSADGFTDALHGLIDAVEDGRVKFWNDDEVEDADVPEFVHGMIFHRGDGVLYVRHNVGGTGHDQPVWDAVLGGDRLTDATITQWLATWDGSTIAYNPMEGDA